MARPNNIHRGENHYKWQKNPNYKAIHLWLSKHYQKTGKCSFCKKRRYTQWAKRQGKVYKRNIDNFIELCIPCHKRYDMKPKQEKKKSKAAQIREVYGNGRKGKKYWEIAEEFGVVYSNAYAALNYFKNRGKDYNFRHFTPEKRKEVAILGNKALRKLGKIHQWSNKEASDAGKIGGKL